MGVKQGLYRGITGYYRGRETLLFLWLSVMWFMMWFFRFRFSLVFVGGISLLFVFFLFGDKFAEISESWAGFFIFGSVRGEF